MGYVVMYSLVFFIYYFIYYFCFFFFFKQKTAYEIYQCDWSSDVCSSDLNIKVLVSSDILAEGVNITSANYIVNFDILFNPAKMEQRIGRIDRIGNKHKVINIVNIIANDIIEQSVFEKVWLKRKMSLNILDDNKFENRLTIKDIKNLLELEL